jgi:hypothetical protein
MPEIIIQRIDWAGYFESYPIYLNRKKQGRLSFAGEIVLNIEKSGRYLVSCGSWSALEDQIWLEVGANRMALQVDRKRLSFKKWRYTKVAQLQLISTIPTRLERKEDRMVRKEKHRKMLLMLNATTALMIFVGIWLALEAQNRGDKLFWLGAFSAWLLIFWLRNGIKKAFSSSP